MNSFVDYTPETSVSVIIAAYNEELFILECVRSILANNYPQELLEVIVVDNGSQDNTRSKLDSIEDLSLIHISEPTRPY